MRSGGGERGETGDGREGERERLERVGDKYVLSRVDFSNVLGMIDFGWGGGVETGSKFRK
jgi:hypothetical protein